MNERNFFGIKKKNKFLDDEIVERLLYAVSEGSYIEDACAFAGISFKNLQMTWRERADAGEEFFVDLFEKIQERESKFKVETLRKIKEIGEEDRNPRALQWILERKYPSQFGETSKLQIQREDVEIVEMEFSDGELYEDFQTKELTDEPDTSRYFTILKQENLKDDTLENHEL